MIEGMQKEWLLKHVVEDFIGLIWDALVGLEKSTNLGRSSELWAGMYVLMQDMMAFITREDMAAFITRDT